LWGFVLHHSCNPPPADVADRVVAVVASHPRNVDLFLNLPKLKLLQSSWYFAPVDTVVQPESVGICMYVVDTCSASLARSSHRVLSHSLSLFHSACCVSSW
jgi:hypothetical protein